MKTMMVSLVAALALSALALGPPVMAQQPSKSGEPKGGESTKDAQTACMNMMQGSGTTEAGKKAVQEFMPIRCSA